MKWCNLVNGYFTGSTADADNDEPMPTPGDWVKAVPPTQEPGMLKYWNSGTGEWGTIVDLGQKLYFGQRAVTKGTFRDRLSGLQQLALDNFDDADAVTALGLTPLTLAQKMTFRSFRESRLDSVVIDPCHPQTVYAIQYYASVWPSLFPNGEVERILTP